MSTQGTAVVDFGTGACDASVTITGQTGFVAGTTLVEAWVQCIASSNNLADNHWVEGLYVNVGNQITGVGFTIYVICDMGKANGQYNINWVWN